MDDAATERRLHRIDWLWLGLLCTLFYGYLLVDKRVLTTHEAIHCQNVREMLADQDWIIPHCGGRPWLERPPLPHWMTAAVVAITGTEQEWGYRLSSALAAVAIVAVVASTVALLYGRALGLLTGLVLVCMHEFQQYATGPESDMFLCLIVSSTLCLFMRMEFARRDPTTEDETSFFGKRSWPMLGFFVLAGLTNLAKGLFFGTIWVVLPVGAYLLLNRDLRAIRRYVWFWGWLAFALVASSWALAAWLREPGILELWQSDYMGRLKEGYMREPRYYYLLALPMVLMPWTLFAFLGLRLTARQAAAPATPERFLWCWALVPLAFFSIPEGKHHHYLLQGVIPWAMLSTWGLIRAWRWLREAPRPMQNPIVWIGLLAVPAMAAVVFFRSKVPGPSWLVPASLIAMPLLIACLHWIARRENPRTACIGVYSLLLACHWISNGYRTRWLERYADDIALTKQVRRIASAERSVPLYVIADTHPLNPAWWLFYIGKDAKLLHNHTFVPTDQVPGSEALLVAIAGMEKELLAYGQVEVVAQSRRSRYELSPSDRYTLFRLRLHESLPRRPSVAVSPMQATGRAPGPFLQ